MNSIKIIDTILKIPRDFWDTMVEGNVFTSYGWLRTVEQTMLQNIIPKYFLFIQSDQLLEASV